MGTDIHAAFQKKASDEKWEDIEHKYEENRHYFLFAWLADVRNGFGFAGVPTHAPIRPIAEPRGLPDDFLMDADSHPVTSLEVMGHRKEYHQEGDELAVWMGDHTHSWLMADEILSAPLPDRVWKTGIVDRAFFDTWDAVSMPDEWSGGISGPDVRVADSPTLVTEESTHVRIYWMQTKNVLSYFIDEIRRLKNEHGEVRMVFGFDS